MYRHFFCIAIIFAAIGFTSCETPYAETEDSVQNTDTGKQQQDGNVTFTVNNFELLSFDKYFVKSRASVNAKEFCSRLTFSVYTDGIRVKSINQLMTEQGFGSVSMQLEPGTYTLVVIGYSGVGNATTTNIEKITFSGNHVSDTFWACQEFTVDNTKNIIPVELQRIVSCVMFDMSDEDIPEGLKCFKFYYTGGSSTLNGQTGYGSVESNQREELTLSKDSVLAIYTIPHYQTDYLDITLTAVDDNGVTIKEKRFPKVEIQVNHISRYTGSFFSGNQDTDVDGSEIDVKGDNEWDGDTLHFEVKTLHTDEAEL